MKTIPLTPHELSQEDYSLFELRLQHSGAVLQAAADLYTTPQGVTYARLSDAAVTFEEAETDAESLENLLNAYGFRRRTT
jgi:hypothetical protein